MKKHCYVIDFESWVYPEDNRFIDLSSKERKKIDKEYVLRSGYAILKLLAKHKVKLTFFVIGEIYEWYPELIRDIQNEGHEIGYHTHQHKLIKNAGILKKQISLSEDFLNDFKPKGFQAPAIFMPEDCYELLKENFVYSSSIYHSSDILNINEFTEIPISTFKFGFRKDDSLVLPRNMNLNLLTKEIPYGSSYFTAILGAKITACIIKKMAKRGHTSKIFIHNWQIFPPDNASFPDGKFLIKNPSYTPYLKNIKNTFEYLLQRFEFYRMDSLL